MIFRLAVLGVAVGSAYGLIGIVERWRFRKPSSLRAGVTLVTSDGCALCPPARKALDSIDYHEIDASAVPNVRSVPTAIVTDAGGRVTMSRSGRSAITDAGAIIAAARDVS